MTRKICLFDKKFSNLNFCKNFEKQRLISFGTGVQKSQDFGVKDFRLWCPKASKVEDNQALPCQPSSDFSFIATGAEFKQGLNLVRFLEHSA